MYSKRHIHKRKTPRRKTHRRRRTMRRAGGGFWDGLTGVLGNRPNQHNPGLLQRAWSFRSMFSKKPSVVDEEKNKIV